MFSDIARNVVPSATSRRAFVIVAVARAHWLTLIIPQHSSSRIRRCHANSEGVMSTSGNTSEASSTPPSTRTSARTAERGDAGGHEAITASEDVRNARDSSFDNCCNGSPPGRSRYGRALKSKSDAVDSTQVKTRFRCLFSSSPLRISAINGVYVNCLRFSVQQSPNI